MAHSTIAMSGSLDVTMEKPNGTAVVDRSGSGPQNGDSISEQSTTADSTPKDGKASRENEKSVAGPKDGKPSGKELKQKAKAEKAARRAKDKQSQQTQPGKAPVASKKGEAAKETMRESAAPGTAQNASKTQDRRTGSMSASGQKAMPIRLGDHHATPDTVEPKKEDKRVALFEHLYGSPRRSSIVGAGKDVHPAVLALGLQMRNYVICGSSARCVATLLVFKRVCGSINCSKQCY